MAAVPSRGLLAAVRSPSVALLLSTHQAGIPEQGPASPEPQVSCLLPPAGAQSPQAVGGRDAGYPPGLHGGWMLCREASDNHHRQSHQEAEGHHQPPLAMQLPPEPRRLADGVEKREFQMSENISPNSQDNRDGEQGPILDACRGEGAEPRRSDTESPSREEQALQPALLLRSLAGSPSGVGHRAPSESLPHLSPP